MNGCRFKRNRTISKTRDRGTSKMVGGAVFAVFLDTTKRERERERGEGRKRGTP